MPPAIAPRDRLIVALDLPGTAAAEAMIAELGDSVTFYKIGMELAFAGGLALIDELKSAGKKVFIDLKLHDIGQTVERATRQISRLGADFLTIHAYPQTMAAAHAGASGGTLRLLAVTVMTSYDDADLAAAGYAVGVAELVLRRAAQACEAKIDGLILSPLELQPIRALVGAEDDSRHARRPAERRRLGRSKARADPRAGYRGGRRLSRGRTACDGSRRSQSGGGSHPNRDRASASG